MLVVTADQLGDPSAGAPHPTSGFRGYDACGEQVQSTPSGFLLRLLASQVTAFEVFGCQMSFEFDSSNHNEFLLDLSYFCNLV